MFANFETYISTQASFTKEELKLIRSLSTEKKLRRKQRLLRDGEVCRYKAFVVKGLLRTFRTKEDGAENIMRFAPENFWTLDPESFHNQTPSKFTIEALEDTEVILWSKENIDELFRAVPAFQTYSEKVRANSFNDIQNRVLINISNTTEEKYQEFITTFPDILRRVPLHMIASYLGVSRETLSRIRRTYADNIRTAASE